MKSTGLNVLKASLLLSIIVSFQGLCHAQQNECAFNSTITRAEFHAKIQSAEVDIKWYPEWLEKNGGKKVLPSPIPPLEKWQHPEFSAGLPYTMHEDAKSSDVSNFPGPIPRNVDVQYFHSLQKGAGFSGMAPAFNFIAEDTLVTLSFGRANTYLALVYIGDTMKLLDAVEVPGRGHSALSLISKEKRMGIFRNTMGGAYSFLSKDRYMYIPAVNSDIMRIYVGDGKFDLNRMDYINVTDQMSWGNILNKDLEAHNRENHLTAILPDKYGNIWFTSQQGIVGVVHHSEITENGCPRVYARMITGFGLIEKLNYFRGTNYKNNDELPDFLTQPTHLTPEMREEFVKYYQIDRSNFEQIQNSFAVGEDGVYIVTDLAFYKLRFNEEEKDLELDPEWLPNYIGGGLMYENDETRKPGHLNAGSGTSPTLMDNRFVAIVDNDTSTVNMCIFSQKTGKLINKFPLFQRDSSACENSIIAYKNTFIVANTYGYVDPFVANETPGGMMRFDYDETKGQFYQREDWPAYDLPLDAKTATPKLSTANGLVYFYNRDIGGGPTPHDDWQLTTLDYETGVKVFSIKPYFNEGEFADNIKGLTVKMSLGKEEYDRKVFNLWGTFCFGPNNSLFIGAYRGFIRFRTDP